MGVTEKTLPAGEIYAGTGLRVDEETFLPSVIEKENEL